MRHDLAPPPPPLPLPPMARFSGSDVSVCVREALMEPLRKCRTARYWQPVRGDGGKIQVRIERGAGGGGSMCCVPHSISTTPPLLPSPAHVLQYTPTMLDPPCGRCPVVLPDAVGPDGKPVTRVPCPYCHHVRMSLYDLASDELRVPLVCAVS
jgi:hypothetical protein